jgi:hypothetical protein
MSLLDTASLASTLEQGVDEVAGVQEGAAIAELAEDLQIAVAEIGRLEESLADLELARDDIGWRRLDRWADMSFTRDGLIRSAKQARVLAIANPLIRRGINLRIAYVWGDGVEIAARATGQNDDNAAEQDVNAVVQAFFDDPATRTVLSGAQAHQENEHTLCTSGMIFTALFTAPRTGAVQPRDIDADEIVDLIRNPEDRTEIWFYKRQATVNGKVRVTYHPDVAYRPRLRPLRVNVLNAQGQATGEAEEVIWDAPVAALMVNRVNRYGFGVGDAYAALPWALAYKTFLEDWAKLVKALSRFAWKLTGEKKGGAQAGAAKIREGRVPTDPRLPLAGDTPVGQTFSQYGANLEAIPKTGATIDSESGRPLAAMVAAGLDVPVTMLLTDPGVTGARATAETLDRPTELMATMRRDLWTQYLQTIGGYVIDAAVRAPAGPLQGTIVRDYLGRETIILAGDTPRTIDVNWPDLTETPVDVLMAALAAADGMDVLPDVLKLRLVLQALKVRDVDEIIDAATDEQGNLQLPDSAARTAGDAAVEAWRRGQDPSKILR